MMPSAKIAMRCDGAAGEHVEHAEHAAGLLLEGLRERHRVDARQRDVGAEAIDDQRAQREPDALLQVFRLGEGAKFRFEASCSAADAMQILRVATLQRPRRAARRPKPRKASRRKVASGGAPPPLYEPRFNSFARAA